MSSKYYDSFVRKVNRHVATRRAAAAQETAAATSQAYAAAAAKAALIAAAAAAAAAAAQKAQKAQKTLPVADYLEVTRKSRKVVSKIHCNKAVEKRLESKLLKGLASNTPSSRSPRR